MSDQTHCDAGDRNASEHVARYEALRSRAVEHHVPAARDGLAVLLRQGVANWMDAWSHVSVPPTRTAQERRPRPWPLRDDEGVEVVRVLAAMALGHIEEMHA